MSNDNNIPIDPDVLIGELMVIIGRLNVENAALRIALRANDAGAPDGTPASPAPVPAP